MGRKTPAQKIAKIGAQSKEGHPSKPVNTNHYSILVEFVGREEALDHLEVGELMTQLKDNTNEKWMEKEVPKQ